MKKIFLSCIAIAYAAGAFAQEYPDAKATNPEKMQWQQGFPPPKEKHCTQQTGRTLIFRDFDTA